MIAAARMVPLVAAAALGCGLALSGPAQAQTAGAAPRAPATPPPRPAQQAVQPAAAPTVGQPAPATETLPNGATSINEVFGDWTVECRITDGRKACALSQAQGNTQTNQRVFAIELQAPKDGRTEGAILMPFGLKLDNGAVLQLDDRNLGQNLRFSTCYPQGCLLPVSFPTVATDAMKSAKTLTAAALNLSNGNPVSFNVSMNGFSAALARITELAN